MKNKRWKREAKRLKANCYKNGLCICTQSWEICQYYDRCNKISPERQPCDIPLRELEIICKNQNK